jgi:hypothetical protein
MTKEKFSGTIENYYGKPLATALSYEAETDNFDGIDEVKSANEFPKDSEIVTFVNAKRKAVIRQRAMQAAVDAAGIVKPTLENDGQLRLKNVFKILVAGGTPEAEARDIASTATGVSWE